MKHKVSGLSGALLDAAVAKAEGYVCRIDDEKASPLGRVTLFAKTRPPRSDEDVFEPSSFWDQGGPIIERERISILRIGGEEGFWQAGFEPECDQGTQCESGWIELPAIDMQHERTGSTPLIAAMRAYVVSKFGEEVELP